jgi:uncharacterized protein (TIRG00374 family)
MKKIVFNTIKYLSFFAVGVLIFWFLYRKIAWTEVTDALRELKYIFIVLSIIFGLLSHFARALRWKMLIKPLGYNPGTLNTFLSILVLYFVNLIVPRAGEVARCTVLSRTDKIPFTKLVGTVFVERLADVIMLFVLAIVIFATNISIVFRFFNENPDITRNLDKLLTFKNLIILLIAGMVLVGFFYWLFKRLKKSDIKEKLIHLKDQFIEGIKSISHMKNRWLFIGYTAFIFFMWLIMLYVVFLAYEPTSHLTLRVGMVTFLMGGLAMLAPVQGGIGPWHFMVVETLILYGIPKTQGLIFAAVAHTSTNLIYIVWGGAALIYFIFKYGNRIIRLKTAENNR